jgi:hypothetical protein
MIIQQKNPNRHYSQSGYTQTESSKINGSEIPHKGRCIMKKLALILIAAAFIFLAAAGSASASDAKFKNYVNSKLGYTVSHPDVFTKSTPVENGAGVTLEDAKGTTKLKIWAEKAKGSETGKTLMTEAKTRVAHISKEQVGDKYFALNYSGGEKDGNEILFFERGFVSGNNIVRFVLSCPGADKAKFTAIVEKMTNDLMKAKAEKANYTPLLEALCFSQVMHYNSFKSEPDPTTTGLTLFNLVANGNFRWKNKLKVEDNAYYFSRGPESETADPKMKGTYISPEMFYSDNFAKGKFAYPPAEMSHLVGGTQTGAAVYLTKAPYKALVQVKNATENNGNMVILATISRVKISDKKTETLGDAVIRLKKDSKGFFGYKVLSFEPKYEKFADMKLK